MSMRRTHLSATLQPQKDDMLELGLMARVDVGASTPLSAQGRRADELK